MTAVYVLVDPDKASGWLKVGIAARPQDRLRAHRTACPAATYVRVWACNDRAAARLLERRALELGASMPGAVRRSEWLRIPIGPAAFAAAVEEELLL